MQPKTLKNPIELDKELREILRHPSIRNNADPLNNFIAPLASLILLRWGSQYEESKGGSLGGADCERFLPDELNWKSWSQLRGDRLTEFLLGKLGPRLRDLPEIGWGICFRAIGNHIYLDPEYDIIIDKVVNWVDEVPLETLQDRKRLGIIFNRVLKDLMKNQQEYSGDYFTPPAVVSLMVELAAPMPGDRIYDPCFGTGGLLVACASWQSEQDAGNGLEKYQIFGIEKDPILYIIAMVRLMLAGIDHPQLELGDTLERKIGPIGSGRKRSSQLELEDRREREIRSIGSDSKRSPQRPQRWNVSGSSPLALQRPRRPGKADPLPSPSLDSEEFDYFDCIVAVPPFVNDINPKVSKRFPVNSCYSETLFLQHIMASLRPGGRAVVALPESFLFRDNAEARVRQILLEKYRVEGVISLPSNALAPYTAVKTSIISFSRQSDRGNDSVRFYQLLNLREKTKLPKNIGNNYAESAAAIYPDTIVRNFREGEPSKYLWETPVTNIKLRGWELLAKQTGEDAVENFIWSVFHRSSHSIYVKNVWAETEIFITMENSSHNRIYLKQMNRVQIVGVADINDGKVRLPWIEKQNHQLEGRYKLKVGDVLVSISGTIGKIGIVSKKIAGAVADNDLAVIRSPSDISPEYLSALLRAPIYQTWLKGHARGSSIQNLSINTLRKIPVPVPPLDIQEKVVSTKHNSAIDTTKRLLACLKQEDVDLLDDWLEAEPIVQNVINAVTSAKREGNLALLLKTGDTILLLWHKIVPVPRQKDRLLYGWLFDIRSSFRQLQGFEEIPPGTARLTVLTNLKLSLTLALQRLADSEEPLVERAREFTIALIELVSSQIQEQVTDVRLEAKLSPPVIATGKPSEVILTLDNSGVIPIRDFFISTNRKLGETKTPYLAEGKKIDVPLTVPAPKASGTLDFEVHWHGTFLNGDKTKGEIPLTLEIRPVVTSFMTKDLGASPYIVGNPVDREEMFFGRDQKIDEIRGQLATSENANVILLEGNRRTGKTSILRYLQLEGKLPGWLVVECSFQGAEGDKDRVGLATKEVFRLMAKQLGIAAHKAGITVQLPDMPTLELTPIFQTRFVKALRQYFSQDNPFEDFELFVQSILEAASPRRILFMLDEFDKLQEGIDSGVTSAQVPENIRYLFQTYPNLSGIITGSRRLKRLREEYWSVLFGLGYRIGLDPLEPDEARKLVTRPVEGRLVYVPQARDRLIALCACQPYLIQVLCNRIFERAAQSGDRTITLSAVQAAADDMVRDNEHFRTLWDYAGTDRRRFILSLCHQLEEGPDPLNMAILENKLEEAEVQITPGKSLDEDLEFLRELELLELDNTGVSSAVYKLAIPLMANWIKAHIDHEDIRRKAVQEGQENFR